MKEVKKLDFHIGDLIRRMRMEAVMSQAKLAARINASYQQVHKYESGATGITVSRLIQIADALGVPARKLIETGPLVDEQPFIGLSDREKTLVGLFRKIKDERMKDNAVFMVEMITRLQR